MPYETNSGTFEKASRLSHSHAAVRALADKASFYVPSETISDTDWLRARVHTKDEVNSSSSIINPLVSALAIDGSHVVQSVRDGMPSVVYGYAQAAAAFVDLQVMETQRAARFVDPVAISRAVNSALVSLDMPVSGAYSRPGVDIATSWRELIYQTFGSKKIEVNNLNKSLLDLLFRLHGTPASDAAGLSVNCPAATCSAVDVVVGRTGADCPSCGLRLFPTDSLRVHEAVGEERTNEEALGRLRSVVELLVLVGLATLLWEQSRTDLLSSTLFLLDGPLAMYGEPAKLRGRAESFFQSMTTTTPGVGPYICGIEKSGAMVDYARQLARLDVIKPGELLVCDEQIIARVANTQDPKNYGKETYWGRKFIYRSRDGRTVVPTVPPAEGSAYDSNGGQTDLAAYPTLGAILDVIDRTGSSMYRDGVIPVAAAHARAAFPIGVGTDVLKLVAKRRLGIDQ